jgi:hypothetical protein
MYVTSQNTVVASLTTQATEILGPNPRRRGLVLSPIALSQVGLGQQSVNFGAGNGQIWVPPPGVTSLDSVRVWGSGGNGTAGQTTAGGGGGGGGGYSELSPMSVAGIGALSINVDAFGGQSQSFVGDLSLNAFVGAYSGLNANGNNGGSGGGIYPGIYTYALVGGNGGTGNVTTGGGGGSSASRAGNGTNGANPAGGIAPSGGGNGGNGALTNVAGTAGTAPGGGGGGGGPTALSLAVGASGQVMILYTPVGQSGLISVDFRPGVQPGLGMLNYDGRSTSPTVIDYDEIGDVLTGPIYAVASLNGLQCAITEIICLNIGGES